MRRTRISVIAVLAMLAWAEHAFAQGKGLFRITTTERLITVNPYGDSNSQMYSIWCQTYGCLGVYDWAQKKYIGLLAEKWEAIDPLTWRFHLRADIRRQRRQGATPSISISSEKLRKVRIRTMSPSTITFSIVGSTATVRMRSAATRI